ncbi:MAG TPA: phenylalanine--tRNA ligase subunit alpha [Candidatus Limnocylindrales bacterium]|nr:phenylalanine--tRNA ligase subunit alpha [Candidatus Limnocylindrales bacterium]
MDLASISADLDALRDRTLTAIAAAPDVAALEQVEAEVMGRKSGALTGIMKGIGALPAGDRPRVGALANAVRDAVAAALDERRAALAGEALTNRLAAERIDVSLPGRPLPRGSLHPLIETNREIARILGQFGFVVAEGPEVETDALNFEALNIPPDHPARDLWDTLYVDAPADPERGRLLLRTHTSPVQIRVMRSGPPPIRALMPGRCFRHEAVDASHGFEFFQMEGLMVDEGTTMAHLRGLLEAFAGALFGADKRTRFRPGYYPFTEPSVAFDVECLVCGGRGCPACKRLGWMTILGAGMVHPVVLHNGGLDPERYQGFAFGMGTDRIAMLRYGITDLRVFLEDDPRFLEQF